MDGERLIQRLLSEAQTATVIKPGDKVLLTFEKMLSAQDIHRVSYGLQKCFPEVNFAIVTGTQTVTIVREDRIEYDPPLNGVIDETGPRPLSPEEYEQFKKEKLEQETNSPVVPCDAPRTD